MGEGLLTVLEGHSKQAVLGCNTHWHYARAGIVINSVGAPSLDL